MRFIRANLFWTDFMCGRWDEALAVADELIAECEAGLPHVLEVACTRRGEMRDAFGDSDGALADIASRLSRAREGRSGRAQRVLGIFAAALADRGSYDEARRLVDELIPLVRTKGLHGGLAWLMPFADELGVRDELRAAVRDAPPPA